MVELRASQLLNCFGTYCIDIEMVNCIQVTCSYTAPTSKSLGHSPACLNLSGPVQCPRHVSHIGHYPDTFEIYQRDGKVETLERSWTRQTKRDWVWAYFMYIVFVNEKRPPTLVRTRKLLVYTYIEKMGWFWLLIGLIKDMSGNRGLEFQDAVSLLQQEDVLWFQVMISLGR